MVVRLPWDILEQERRRPLGLEHAYYLREELAAVATALPAPNTAVP